MDDATVTADSMPEAADGLGPARPRFAMALRRTSAAEQVADALTALILDGTLGAGERLRESALSQVLGISRNSVREGIRLLERGRLVRYEMHRGAVVATPSVEELDDLYRTRMHLEALAATVTPSPAQATALQAAYSELETAAASGQAREIVTADMAFHATLVDWLDSERLSAFFDTVTTEIGYYLLILSHADDEPGRADEAVLAQHRLLLEAVLAGDPQAARTAVVAHLEQNHRRIRQILQGAPAVAAPPDTIAARPVAPVVGSERAATMPMQ